MVDVTKKKFNFYYKNSVQILKLYEGTKQEEIISTLYKLLNVDQSKILYFYDEDGDQIVISSSMPNDIKIFIKDEFLVGNKEFGKQDENNKDSNLSINSDVNTDQTNINKEISIEKSVINEKEWSWIQTNSVTFLNKNSFKTSDENKTLVFGNISFTSGVYYWSFKISHLYCCHDFGIIENTNPHNFKASYWNDSTENVLQIGLPSILEGEEVSSVYSNKITGPAYTSLGDANLKNMYFGCFLDMDKKYFCIFNETKEKLYKSTKLNKIEKATPYYFANKHGETIDLVIKNPPDFVLKTVEKLKL